jgi:hypothetical protein
MRVPRIIICIQNINKFKKKLVVLKPVVLCIFTYRVDPRFDVHT